MVRTASYWRNWPDSRRLPTLHTNKKGQPTALGANPFSTLLLTCRRMPSCLHAVCSLIRQSAVGLTGPITYTV